MPGYIGNVPTPQSTQFRQTFTATAGQTTFGTVGYSIGYIDVFLNGVHLVDGTDYTATNGSDIVLSSGAALNDVLEVVIYSTFEVANFTNVGSDIVPSTDDTFDLGSSSKAWAEVHADKILTDTFEDRSASKSIDAVYVTDGTAKAWASYSPSGSSINDSLNISSLTDNTTGDFTLNFSNNFFSINYVFTGRAGASTSRLVEYAYFDGTDQGFSVGGFRGEIVFADGSAVRTNFDYARATAAFHGDLA